MTVGYLLWHLLQPWCMVNPGQYFFDQRSMRKHLWSCLQNQRMLMFPVIKERRRKQKVKTTQKIPLHCFSCLPGISGIRLIECSKCKIWYHIDICVPVNEQCLLRDIVPNVQCS